MTPITLHIVLDNILLTPGKLNKYFPWNYDKPLVLNSTVIFNLSHTSKSTVVFLLNPTSRSPCSKNWHLGIIFFSKNLGELVPIYTYPFVI